MFSIARSLTRIRPTIQLDCLLRTAVTHANNQKKFDNPKRRGWITRLQRKIAAQKKKNEFAKRQAVTEKYKDVVPLIECKNYKLNHYDNITYASFVPLPLASQGWYHRRSAGDFFIIHDAVKSKEEIQKESKRLQEIPNFLRVEDFGWVDGEKTNEGLVSFSDLGLDEDLLKALDKLGIKEPSEIQKQGIPPIAVGRNVTLTAETGCGKTLAFLLPLVQHIAQYKKMKYRPNDALDSPFVIIISPSRELASQIFAVAKFLSKYKEFVPKLIVGGETSRLIKRHQFSEVDMVVGSLGALSKFITKGVLLTNHLRSVVLDEADTLLDENFNEKLIHLLKRKIMVKPKRSVDDPGVQLIMVSATLPEALPDTFGPVIPLEDLVQVCTEECTKVLPKVKQKFVRVNHTMRASLLLDMVTGFVKRREPVIIFSHTSKGADWVTLFLGNNKVEAITLHGDMDLGSRSVAFERFREGETLVLSCTSMASLGLDTKWVKHVINFDAPQMMFDYIHRVGRVGRMGGAEDCTVTTFVVRGAAIALAQRLEKSVRLGKGIPQNEPNVRRRIRKGNTY